MSSSELDFRPRPDPAVADGAVSDRVAARIAASAPAATRRAYTRDWAGFQD